MALPINGVPADQFGAYPALAGAVPVTMGQRVAARLLEGAVAVPVYVLAVLGNTAAIFILVIFGVAELILMFTQGATFGHLALGLRHVSVHTGKIAGGSTFLKYLLEGLVGGFTLGIGHLIAILTIRPPLQRNWYDRAVGVMVINHRRSAPLGGGDHAAVGPGVVPGSWAQPSGASAPAPAPRQASGAPDRPQPGLQGWAPPTGILEMPPTDIDLRPEPLMPAHSAWPTSDPADRPAAPAAPPGPPMAGPATAPAGEAGQTIIADVLRPTWDRNTDEKAAVVHLDDDALVALDGPCILGRSPSMRPGLEGARLVAIPDEEMSLSKTHLAIGPAPGGAWVMDLHSTNGVRLVLPNGEKTTLNGGQRYEVPLGSTIEYGLRTLSVSSSVSSS